tara:strand:- start:469 stop:657 length:189 start_codon:yes stop_codon:yes gene_type:complete
MSKEINLNVLKHRMLTEIDKLDKELSDLDSSLCTIIASTSNIKSQLAALKQDILNRLDIPSP